MCEGVLKAQTRCETSKQKETCKAPLAWWRPFFRRLSGAIFMTSDFSYLPANSLL